MTRNQYGISPLVSPMSLRGETSPDHTKRFVAAMVRGVAQCQLFSQANWEWASSIFWCFDHAANVLLSKYLARWLKMPFLFTNSFIYSFICLFCHTSIWSLLQTLTVVSRNVAIEKINMTEHRIVEMVGGTWYHVLRLTIDYKFCLHFFFSLTLMKELNFLFIYRYTHF